MQLKVNISGYEGPLDLLLELSKKQKVDIKKISLLELAEQYLDFIDKNLHQLKLSADYLVMASLLAYLKSKLLLPKEDLDETQEIEEDLTTRLLHYGAIKKLAEKIINLPQEGKDFFYINIKNKFVISNKHLIRDLIDLDLWNKDVKNELIKNRGSIQHIESIPEHIKKKYKTVWEISMKSVIDMAKDRGAYICQSQSVNLFFSMPKATESQTVHDEYLQYVNDVHWYAMNKLKSLYYFRSDAARSAENVNIKIPRVKLEDVECLSCEG